MRTTFDNKIRTLEQDINEIWSLHGWEVVEEVVPPSDGVTVQWIITAKLKEEVIR